MGISIILADDHAIVREGLRSLFDKKQGMEIIAEAGTGTEAVKLARELKPDIVIMDITMPDLNGMEATRQIKEELPNTKIIALSMHSDRRFVIKMLSAGASGYVLKHSASRDQLTLAIQTVLKGEVFVSSRILGVIARDYVRYASGQLRSEPILLTAREREILQLIAEGKPTKAIAHQLKSSVKTIDKHRQHIMEKLEIRSVAELTKYAIREGLTSVEE
jgi:DNA-binding NarL/FixJ family response regulator